MYYDKDIRAPSSRADDPENQRVLAWQHDVAKSTASEASIGAVQPMPLERVQPQVIVNQIIQPAVVVSRVRPEESKSTDEISTRAIVGTILGATAGAVVAYAMTKGDSESHQQPAIERKITYRTIEAPAAKDLVRQDIFTRNAPSANSNPVIRTIPIESASRTQANILAPPSEHSRHSYHTVVRSADAGPVVQTRSGTRISTVEPRGSRVSHISSSSNTVRQAEMVPLPPTVVTVKSAKDIPLPASLVSREREEPKLDDRSVHPHDSVSQVSSRRSGKTKHYHTGSNKSGSERSHGHKRERSSKAGSSKKETSSKISAVRSTGMKGALGF